MQNQDFVGMQYVVTRSRMLCMATPEYIAQWPECTMNQPECIGLSLVVTCFDLGKWTKHKRQTGADQVLSS